MFTVFVHGLELYAYHGATRAEQEVGHRFAVDVEVEVVGDASVTDRLEDTVDYGALASLAQEVLARGPFTTVERVAGELAREVLDRFPLVTSATVNVAKRLPPIEGTVDRTGVRLTLRRS